MDPVKRNILEVALAEFAHYGFKGTRIESIAEGTHTSKRMIYYHFGSKERLYAEVLEFSYRIVREGQALEALDAKPPMEALIDYVSYAFINFNKHPDFIRLTLQENLSGARFLQQSPAIVQLNQASFAVLRRIIERGQAEGSMRQDIDPMNVYINYIGLCHYHISSRANYRVLFDYDNTRPEHMQSRLEAIRDSVVRYVRP